MAFLSALPPGTAVIATEDFGPIIRGQLGITVGRRQSARFPWQRSAYVCTFLGGITVTAAGRHIMPHDHGCGWQMLEDPFWFLHTRTVPEKYCKFAAEVRRPTRWPG